MDDGRKAFGQYVYQDKRYGPIIRIFDFIVSSKEKVDSNKLDKSNLRFPPIFMVGLYPVFRTGRWKVLGKSTLEDFTYPGFLTTAIDYKEKNHGFWFLIDEKSSTNLGRTLPKKYKKMEFLALYPPEVIEDRIKTGLKYLGDLIETNEFKPVVKN